MKKLLSVILVLVLVLGLAVPVFADYTGPTAHSTASKPGSISSVVIEGVTAYYETDTNTGDAIYIRAVLPTTKTEYDLKTASVVITTTGSNYVPSISGHTATVDGNAYTFVLDLYNNAYTVTIGANNYTLAAGIADGIILVDDSMNLGFSGTMNNATVSVYGSSECNPYMGNPYFSGWTYINYYATCTLPQNSVLNNITGHFVVATNSSLTGGGVSSYTSDTDGVFNFNTNHTILVSEGTLSRSYTTCIAVSGVDVIVGIDNSGNRNYDIDLSEVIGSYYYQNDADVEAAVDSIVIAWDAYMEEPHTFSSGVSVMGIMEAFIYWAETEGYFNDVSNTGDGYYLSELNGLDASDCGYMAGYMYTDDSRGLFHDEDEHSNIPMIGANDYIFTNSTRIVWFYTVDYSEWLEW